MIDVNIKAPDFALDIDRVGISEIYLPVLYVNIGSKKVSILAKASAYIDLPARYKGIHASRNYESIIDVFMSYINSNTAMKIEEYCSNVAIELLRRHSYASKSLVYVDSIIIYPDRTPLGRLSYERAHILAKAFGYRYDNAIMVKKYIGVKVYGITACPCAQRVIEEILVQEAKSSTYYKPTHMQRAFARVYIQVPDSFDIDAFELIKLVRDSMSSPTYELMKRDDEARVILNALDNPKFVEDVARDIARRIINRYFNLPDDTSINIYVKSFESIHQHNLIASINTTIGLLRRIYEALKT